MISIFHARVRSSRGLVQHGGRVFQSSASRHRVWEDHGARYRTFCSLFTAHLDHFLPHIWITFYHTFGSLFTTHLDHFLQHIWITFYRTFTTFWQADSGGTSSRIAPAGPIKNNFLGGGGGSDRRAVTSEGTGWV